NSHRANSTILPRLSTRTNTTASPPQHPSQPPSGGSFRSRRLGEAVSSQTSRNPQEENSDNVIFSSPAHVLLHFSQPKTHKPHTKNSQHKPTTPKAQPESPRKP